MVSPRALIMRAPMLGSFDHDGIKPQCTSAHSRMSAELSNRTMPTGCVGEMLNRSAILSGASTSNCAAICSGEACKVNRPHIVHSPSLYLHMTTYHYYVTLPPNLRAFRNWTQGRMIVA